MKDQKHVVEELLDLENLTETERSRILEVLKRDDELQDAQNTRISDIKSEINAIRMKGVLRQGEDGSKICSRCREQFGYIFNTGEICSQCKYKVCKNCKESTFHGAWVCVLCYKRRQLRALTGEWLMPTLTLEKKSKNLYLSAPDLIRKSIRRKGRDDEDHDEDHDEDEDAQDNIVNGNARYMTASPEFESSSLSSDNSSLPGNDMGSPKETDMQKLSSLVHAHSLNDNSPGKDSFVNYTSNNNTVHKISTKRYEDTESSSSDDEQTLSPLNSVITSPSLRSSNSPPLSTGRTNPASETHSDQEDCRYGNDRNQNGIATSPANRSREHFKIQQLPAPPSENGRVSPSQTGRVSPFDDSAYRAHSELPDIDDLIAKSKAKQDEHSPLSSMTSSPTPSTHGQRLLDLANVSDSVDGYSDKDQPPSQKQQTAKHGKNKDNNGSMEVGWDGESSVSECCSTGLVSDGSLGLIGMEGEYSSSGPHNVNIELSDLVSHGPAYHRSADPIGNCHGIEIESKDQCKDNVDNLAHVASTAHQASFVAPTHIGEILSLDQSHHVHGVDVCDQVAIAQQHAFQYASPSDCSQISPSKVNQKPKSTERINENSVCESDTAHCKITCKPSVVMEEVHVGSPTDPAHDSGSWNIEQGSDHLTCDIDGRSKHVKKHCDPFPHMPVLPAEQDSNMIGSSALAFPHHVNDGDFGDDPNTDELNDTDQLYVGDGSCDWDKEVLDSRELAELRTVLASMLDHGPGQGQGGHDGNLSPGDYYRYDGANIAEASGCFDEDASVGNGKYLEEGTFVFPVYRAKDDTNGEPAYVYFVDEGSPDSLSVITEVTEPSEDECDPDFEKIVKNAEQGENAEADLDLIIEQNLSAEIKDRTPSRRSHSSARSGKSARAAACVKSLIKNGEHTSREETSLGSDEVFKSAKEYQEIQMSPIELFLEAKKRKNAQIASMSEKDKYVRGSNLENDQQSIPVEDTLAVKNFENVSTEIPNKHGETDKDIVMEMVEHPVEDTSAGDLQSSLSGLNRDTSQAKEYYSVETMSKTAEATLEAQVPHALEDSSGPIADPRTECNEQIPIDTVAIVNTETQPGNDSPTTEFSSLDNNNNSTDIATSTRRTELDINRLDIEPVGNGSDLGEENDTRVTVALSTLDEGAESAESASTDDTVIVVASTIHSEKTNFEENPVERSDTLVSETFSLSAEIHEIIKPDESDLTFVSEKKPSIPEMLDQLADLDSDVQKQMLIEQEVDQIKVNTEGKSTGNGLFVSIAYVKSEDDGHMSNPGEHDGNGMLVSKPVAASDVETFVAEVSASNDVDLSGSKPTYDVDDLSVSKPMETCVDDISVSKSVDNLSLPKPTETSDVDGLSVSKTMESSDLDDLYMSKTMETPDVDGLLVSKPMETSDVDDLLVSKPMETSDVDGLLVSKPMETSDLDGLLVSKTMETSDLDLSVSKPRETSSVEVSVSNSMETSDDLSKNDGTFNKAVSVSKCVERSTGLGDISDRQINADQPHTVDSVNVVPDLTLQPEVHVVSSELIHSTPSNGINLSDIVDTNNTDVVIQEKLIESELTNPSADVSLKNGQSGLVKSELNGSSLSPPERSPLEPRVEQFAESTALKKKIRKEKRFKKAKNPIEKSAIAKSKSANNVEGKAVNVDLVDEELDLRLVTSVHKEEHQSKSIVKATNGRETVQYDDLKPRETVKSKSDLKVTFASESQEYPSEVSVPKATQSTPPTKKPRKGKQCSNPVVDNTEGENIIVDIATVSTGMSCVDISQYETEQLQSELPNNAFKFTSGASVQVSPNLHLIAMSTESNCGDAMDKSPDECFGPSDIISLDNCEASKNEILLSIPNIKEGSGIQTEYFEIVSKYDDICNLEAVDAPEKSAVTILLNSQSVIEKVPSAGFIKADSWNANLHVDPYQLSSSEHHPQLSPLVIPNENPNLTRELLALITDSPIPFTPLESLTQEGKSGDDLNNYSFKFTHEDKPDKKNYFFQKNLYMFSFGNGSPSSPSCSVAEAPSPMPVSHDQSTSRPDQSQHPKFDALPKVGQSQLHISVAEVDKSQASINEEILEAEFNSAKISSDELPPDLETGTKSSPEPSMSISSDQTDASSGHGYDSGHLTGTSQENSPEHRHSKKLSGGSMPSITVSSVEEEDESIDEFVTLHKPKTFSQTFGNLFSTHGGSRESIASYYSQAGAGNYGVVEVTGAVQFAVDYKHKTGVLEIHVKQASDLAAVDDKNLRSDPYVKTYLLPDRTKTGKKKTHAKKHTLNPVFNETLRYHAPKSELQSRTLWLSVWHNDRFGRNIFLGEVTLPFNYHTFDSTPQWYTLQDREEMEPSMLSYKGDLIISLKYVPADEQEESSPGKDKKKKKKSSAAEGGQLCVLVKEARNLTGVRANGYSDSFCKGYLLPEKTRSVKQKTPVIKKECNPKWSHMFMFEDLASEELEYRCLELTIWDHDRFSSNDFLGGLRLNIGTGRSRGKEVDWMDARGEEISIWQSMMDRPNVWIDGNINLRANMDKRQ